MAVNRDIQQTITERIVAALEQAARDNAAGKGFRLPWANAAASGEPMSLRRRPYRGINYVILKMLAGVYPSQVFGTYNGWKEIGAQVRKGEKGINIIFWKPLRIKDKETREEKEILFARGFTVFAAEQVENFDISKFRKPQPMPNGAEILERAETVLKGFARVQGIEIIEGGNAAYYRPSTDSIGMPFRSQFRSTEGYYSTLAHELVHATGAEKRLNRTKGKRFGDSAYAFEELVAELGAAMLCGMLGVSNEPRADHAQYLASWLEVLKHDSKAIISAASLAQKAADMIAPEEVAEEIEEEKIAA